MSTAELKEKLIAQINDTDNDELLSEISTMLYVESKSVNGVYQMSEGEREAVEEGLEQFKNGQWITHEESNKRAEEWLKKYDGQ
jgi:predicted transcriptional regulator